MIKMILLVLFYLLFPLVIIFLCKKWSLLRKFGTIVMAYLFGLIIGTAGIFPEGSEGYRLELQNKPYLEKPVLEALIEEGKAVSGDIMVNNINELQDTLYSFALLLAFPLLLFSLNIRRWLKFAKKGFLSVALALVAGIIMVTTGFFIWKNAFPDAWKLAGMFEGIYTGGTPNFAALKLILDVDADRFVVLFTYDTVVGAFLVLFFVSVAPRIFRAILPKFEEKNGIAVDEDLVKKETEGLDDFSGMLTKKNFFPLLKALGLSIVIGGIGGVLYMFAPVKEEYRMAVMVLSVTTLGILASFIKSVNKTEKTFQLGMYLILIFSLTVATKSDLRTLFGQGMWNLVFFISWCYWGSLLLHLILAKIFRIDADNFLITATAFVFSPPFVPLVANALRNKDVIVTGLTGGVIGYLLGNYFGTTLAYLLKGF
ncbi:MAG: hypothetical protein H6Q24_646 [Bacteroidetes bacterium]|nr:hypothetical protein [Bacteroidota bacterium]